MNQNQEEMRVLGAALGGVASSRALEGPDSQYYLMDLMGYNEGSTSLPLSKTFMCPSCHKLRRFQLESRGRRPSAGNRYDTCFHSSKMLRRRRGKRSLV